MTIEVSVRKFYKTADGNALVPKLSLLSIPTAEQLAEVEQLFDNMMKSAPGNATEMTEEEVIAYRELEVQELQAAATPEDYTLIGNVGQA